MTIKDALILQKRELDSRLNQEYVRRDIDEKKLTTPLIKVIIGPRRAGKSFFGLHLLKKLDSFGYANFDDESLVNVKDYNEIITSLNVVYNNPKNLLLDEIQNLKDWELFANRLQRQGFNLVITGSNSNLLSKDLATHLTGRHSSVLVLPFSFKESLQNRELTNAEIKIKCEEYVLKGGFPEPLLKNLDYADYLCTLFNSIIYKDIVKRYNIRNAPDLENLAFYLLSNIGTEFSYNSLSKSLNFSYSTAFKYLKYLEDSFLFFSLNRFSYKIKEQVSRNKKIYCIDNGFIYAKAFKVSQNFGKLYENIVAISLKRLELLGKIGLYYWKNQQQEEVDFVVKEGLKIKQLIQVCFDVSNEKTKNREIRALLKAGSELNCKDLIVITADYELNEDSEWFGLKGKIKFVSLHNWLLSE